MINLKFFPSRNLALYMVRLFLTRSVAVLIALVLVLMTLDLLGESGKILAAPGNGDAELWRYVGLRIPLLASRFLPFSVLLGTLIAFVGLNQHSEVVAMKAAGLSAHQILAPLILASIGIAALLFAFNEGVVVKSARVVNAWSDNDYKPIPPQSGILGNVWILNGDDLIRAGIVAGQGPQLTAQQVTIYDRTGGVLQRVIQADRAIPDPRSGDWQLQGVRLYDANMNVIRNVPRDGGDGRRHAVPADAGQGHPDELDYWTLKQRIAELEAAGRPADEARAGLAHKISGPLSTLLMPLLAAVAAFGLARSGQVLIRATVGMALGFAYFVADNFSLAMGNAGAYPPLDRRLGAVLPVPADRRNRAHPHGGMITRSHKGSKEFANDGKSRAVTAVAVSVIVPCHNAAEFLADALQSVRDQTLRDLECIIIDDSSIDGSVAIANRFVNADPRFSLIISNERQGASAATQRGHRTGDRTMARLARCRRSIPSRAARASHAHR